MNMNSEIVNSMDASLRKQHHCRHGDEDAGHGDNRLNGMVRAQAPRDSPQPPMRS